MKAKRLNRKTAIYTPVSGTTVRITYLPDREILEVEFVGGRTYHYLDVAQSTWDDYKAVVAGGGSSGTFVNKTIKPFYESIEIV